MSELSDKNTEENPTRGHPSISMDEIIKLQDAAEAGDLQAQTRLAEIEGLDSYEEYKRRHQQVSVKFEMDTDPKYATILKSISDAAVSKPLMDQIREMFEDASNPLNKVSANLIEEIQKTFKPETVTKLQEIIGLESSKEKWISELSKIDWSQFLTQGTMDMPIKALDNESVSASLLVPYYPNVEVQLMDEMAQNNRLNRQILEELRNQNSRSGSENPPGFRARFPDDEYLIRLQTSLEYWPAPFDTLDSTLWHVLEVAQRNMLALSFHRESTASAKAIYYIDWKLNSEKSIRLGSIELRQLDSNVTEVRIESLVTGERVKSFVEIVRNLRGYSEDAKNISKLVLDNSKDAVSEEAQVGVGKKLRCPKEGSKRLITWQATWRKIKGRVQYGDNYQELAKSLERTNLRASPELIADIVKAGHAGLLD